MWGLSQSTFDEIETGSLEYAKMSLRNISSTFVARSEWNFRCIIHIKTIALSFRRKLNANIANQMRWQMAQSISACDLHRNICSTHCLPSLARHTLAADAVLCNSLRGEAKTEKRDESKRGLRNCYHTYRKSGNSPQPLRPSKRAI